MFYKPYVLRYATSFILIITTILTTTITTTMAASTRRSLTSFITTNRFPSSYPSFFGNSNGGGGDNDNDNTGECFRHSYRKMFNIASLSTPSSKLSSSSRIVTAIMSEMNRGGNRRYNSNSNNDYDSNMDDFFSSSGGKSRDGQRGRSSASGGRGGGRSSGGRGGGRSSGGRGVGGNNSGNGRSNNGNNMRPKTKTGRKALQEQAVTRKANSDVAYFRRCQQEAATGNGGGPMLKSEKELFGGQIPQGINFDNYDDIQVEVKQNTGGGNGGASSRKSEQSQQPPLEFTDFNKLPLNSKLQNNIQRMGYSKSTPIQRHAIPIALSNGDLMCCAQTGSGKTCAFLLPVCASLLNTLPKSNTSNSSNNKHDSTRKLYNEKSISPKCIILAPTRELAIQIELEAQKLTHETSLRSVCLYGGAPAKAQLRSLTFGCDICVATPVSNILLFRIV